jgi:DNA-binding response OmpR family regulator
MLFGKKPRRITRILVVEDEPLVAFETEHHLTEEGFEIVATVDSVADANAVLGSGRDIHLVLVDMTLIDGSGIDVARTASGQGVHVMFVTAECPGEVARGLAAGCLSKPYAARDLTAAIAAVERVVDGGPPPKRLPPSFSLFAAEV